MSTLPQYPYWGAQFARNDTARPTVPPPTNPGGAWLARQNGMYTPDNREAMCKHLHHIMDGAVSLDVIRATMPGLLQEFSTSMEERDQVSAVLSPLDRVRYNNEEFLLYASSRLREGRRTEPYHTADIEANLSRVQGGEDCGTFGRQTPLDFIYASQNYWGTDAGGLYNKYNFTGRPPFYPRDPEAGASSWVQNNINPIGAEKNFLNAQSPDAANPLIDPTGTYIDDSEPIQLNTARGRESIYEGRETFNGGVYKTQNQAHPKQPQNQAHPKQPQNQAQNQTAPKKSALKQPQNIHSQKESYADLTDRQRALRPTSAWNAPAHEPQTGVNRELERARQLQWGIDIGSVSPFLDDCEKGPTANSRAAVRNAAEILLDGWGSYDPSKTPFTPPDVRPRQEEPVGACGFPMGDGPYTKARWDYSAHARKGATKERISRKSKIGVRAYDRDIDEDLAATQYDGIVRGQGGANPLNSATAQSTIVNGELGGDDGGIPAYQRTTKHHWAGMDRHAALDYPGTQRNGRSNNPLDQEGPGRATQAGRSQYLRAYNRNLVRYTHPYTSS